VERRPEGMRPYLFAVGTWDTRYRRYLIAVGTWNILYKCVWSKWMRETLGITMPVGSVHSIYRLCSANETKNNNVGYPRSVIRRPGEIHRLFKSSKCTNSHDKNYF
jgi:hypothetical protein